MIKSNKGGDDDSFSSGDDVSDEKLKKGNYFLTNRKTGKKNIEFDEIID